MLRHVSDSVIKRPDAGDVFPEDIQIATIKAKESHNGAYERGLAGAIRAEQTVRQTPRYSDAQAIQGSETTEGLDKTTGIYSLLYAPPLLFLMMKMMDATATIGSAAAQRKTRLWRSIVMYTFSESLRLSL